MPAAMAAMRASPPITPPTIGPTGVELGVGVGTRVVGGIGGCDDDVVDTVWEELIDVLDIIVDPTVILVGFVNTRPSCPV